MRVRTAAEESLSSERGRPAAPRLATMTEAGREDSELSWGRRHGKVALSSEEDARALRRQACLTSGISGERSESAACRG